MASVYLRPTVQWYKDQVGYSSGSTKSSKYSKELDSVNFYNTKKNGYANWCAIFYDAGIYENSKDASTSEVRAFVYEPNSDNCGAGCAQKVDYYKSHGAWYPHKVKGCPAQTGDEIFFAASQYKSSTNPLGVYHTGAVVDWDSKYLYTVEGNTDGGKVTSRKYSYGDERICGFGRPNWTGVNPPEKENTNDDTQTPSGPQTKPPSEQEPNEAYSGRFSYYKVKTNTGVALRIRTSPRTSSVQIGYIPNGRTCKVYYIENGWAKVEYDGVVGYSYATYLKKV